jgi:DNA-binding NarL/FixJ family response regulator
MIKSRLEAGSGKRHLPPDIGEGSGVTKAAKQTKRKAAQKKFPTAEPTSKARIFLIDDHAVVRYGIGQLIDKQSDLMVCGESEGANEALKALPTAKPDLIILDISLKESSGLDLIRTIKAQSPQTLVLVVSMHDESVYAEMALRAGASGYIMKEQAITNVLTAIRRVLDGGIYVSDTIAGKVLEQQIRGQTAHKLSPIDRLSPRELEVLRLIGQWKGTRQIASELHLSIKTVEYYLEQIKKKLSLKNSAMLVQYAVAWLQQDSTTNRSVLPPS